MGDVPRFFVRPPLRCFHRFEETEGCYCGEIAPWMRPGAASVPIGYFCDEHRRAGDVRIPDDVLFERISITAQIDFAGITWGAGVSRAEAIARLEEAIRIAGGLLNLHTITSAVGRYSPSPLPDAGKPGRPRRLER